MTEVIEIGGWEVSVLWSPWYSYLLFAVKYFLMFYTVVLFIAIILIFVRIRGGFKIRIKEAVEEAMEVGKLPKTRTQKKMEAISSAIESDKPEDYEKAVVLAGKFFDEVLKAANFSGDNLEKRVSKVPERQLNFKEDIIWACRLKEKILADEEFKVDREEAIRAVHIFQRALKEIGII